MNINKNKMKTLHDKLHSEVKVIRYKKRSQIASVMETMKRKEHEKK